MMFGEARLGADCSLQVAPVLGASHFPLSFIYCTQSEELMQAPVSSEIGGGRGIAGHSLCQA